MGAKEFENAGTSKPSQISTSHIERSNLTIRMQNRRFTRLTNAFSKKWENHELMFALFVAWYNFCRPQYDTQGHACGCGRNREGTMELGAVVSGIGAVRNGELIEQKEAARLWN